MATQLDVANMAIAHTGEGKPISSFEEESAEARESKRFILISRDTILRGYDWTFARRDKVPLQLLAVNPNYNWAYAYLYPRDCMRITQDNDVPHRRSLVGTERAILANESKLALNYISGEIPDNYPEDFSLAWSFHMAILLAPQITEGKLGLLPQLKEKYDHAMGVAMENNENEKQEPTELNPAIVAGGFEI